MPWTEFHDMHSGGGRKEPFARCFIEAPEEEAKRVFFARFGHNPDRVSCTCCGPDYSIDEDETLEQATAYIRHLTHAHSGDWHAATLDERRAMQSRYFEPDEPLPEGWVADSTFHRGDPIPMDVWLADPHVEDFGREEVVVIRADEITAEERGADVPEQGYVWR